MDNSAAPPNTSCATKTCERKHVEAKFFLQRSCTGEQLLKLLLSPSNQYILLWLHEFLINSVVQFTMY